MLNSSGPTRWMYLCYSMYSRSLLFLALFQRQPINIICNEGIGVIIAVAIGAGALFSIEASHCGSYLRVQSSDLWTLCLVRGKREPHFESFPHCRSLMKYSVEVQENCCSMQERTALLLIDRQERKDLAY
jgi:hypothetical protein